MKLLKLTLWITVFAFAFECGVLVYSTAFDPVVATSNAKFLAYSSYILGCETISPKNKDCRKLGDEYLKDLEKIIENELFSKK